MAKTKRLKTSKCNGFRGIRRILIKSSLRAVLPSGSVVSVERVKLIAEKIILFNGRKRRMVEVADNMKKESNGACISLDMTSSTMDFGSPMMNSDVIIGNLGKEKVCEVIRQFNEKEILSL